MDIYSFRLNIDMFGSFSKAMRKKYNVFFRMIIWPALQSWVA